MKKIKLMTVVGTRPEVIKLSETIKLCDQVFDHILVHTGQNYDYELNQIFFDGLGLREPDRYMGVVGADLGETMGNVLSKSYRLMREMRPDALLILGDTNSCLCAISAKRLKIPIFHMEAGNRCFDENLPEEVNRRIVDKGIEFSKVLQLEGLEPGGYILLSAHREENVDDEDNFASMVEAVNTLAEESQMPVLYSMHPRARARAETCGTRFHPLVRAHRPFGFHDYVALQKSALCVVSDSGTLAEESAILGFPAVSLRTSTERPEVVDKGVFTLGSITAEGLLQAVAVETALAGDKITVPDYSDSLASIKVVKIIQGFTCYVNKLVWKKGFDDSRL